MAINYAAAETAITANTAAGRAQATRFLQRSTFGPRPGDVAALQTMGVQAWFDAEEAKAHDSTYYDVHNATNNYLDRQRWARFITGDGQLRQRVAYSLSQIFCMNPGGLGKNANVYIDTLHDRAFGTYREAMEAVTYSMSMGTFLTYLRNVRFDPVTGQYPDENYARELWQLFSIGLWELNDDGTRKKDGNGADIPTYEQTDILEHAKVFTGLREVTSGTDRELQPLYEWLPAEDYHEFGAKSYLGVDVPAGNNVDADIALSLDTLDAHPSLPPFVAKLLIQRHVTSNPSPAYVNRVVQEWKNDGNGVRGNIAHVIRAILLDSEALTSNPPETFGKLKEPALRLTHTFRALGASTTQTNPGAWPFAASERLGQNPWEPPSVFNFYRPGYTPSGTRLGEAGLVGPELQLSDASTAVNWVNWIYDQLDRVPGGLVFDEAPLQALAGTPSALVDELEARLCPGRLSQGRRDQILAVLPSITTSPADHRKVMAAVLIIITSPDFLYER